VSQKQISGTDLELEEIMRRIEAEPIESCCARERSAFDEIAGDCRERLVLFGAGPLGKAVLEGLRTSGIEPLAFADNRIEGGHVMGVPVLSAAEAAERYGETACFVVTIYQGSSVREQLASRGCRRVAHFAPLFWKYAEVFIPHGGIDLPHRLRGEFEAIRSCHAALADDWSKRELCEQLLWRYWLNFSVVSPGVNARDTYFPFDLLGSSDEEVFVDCGGFDGDTVLGFSKHWEGRFRHAFTFEPDPTNREALASNVEKAGLGTRVTVMPHAIGDRNGPVSFSFNSSAASHLAAKETGATIDCRRLDDIEWPMAPTYIKMDIESAEPEALAGATELLRRYHPVLAVCTYHRSEHLWQIPNLIRSIAPEYYLFLRRYAEDCWEGVCYAIPENRLSDHRIIEMRSRIQNAA
jgi:FkbM family methyltransferase